MAQEARIYELHIVTITKYIGIQRNLNFGAFYYIIGNFNC